MSKRSSISISGKTLKKLNKERGSQPWDNFLEKLLRATLEPSEEDSGEAKEETALAVPEEEGQYPRCARCQWQPSCLRPQLNEEGTETFSPCANFRDRNGVSSAKAPKFPKYCPFIAPLDPTSVMCHRGRLRRDGLYEFEPEGLVIKNQETCWKCMTWRKEVRAMLDREQEPLPVLNPQTGRTGLSSYGQTSTRSPEGGDFVLCLDGKHKSVNECGNCPQYMKCPRIGEYLAKVVPR